MPTLLMRFLIEYAEIHLMKVHRMRDLSTLKANPTCLHNITDDRYFLFGLGRRRRNHASNSSVPSVTKLVGLLKSVMA